MLSWRFVYKNASQRKPRRTPHLLVRHQCIVLLSRVSILTRDIDIANLSIRLSVRLSVCLSVRYVPVFYGKQLKIRS